MAMTEEEKKKLAAERSLLEEEEMQTRINRGLKPEIEKPVKTEDESLKFKPQFPDDPHWKKILQKYKDEYPDQDPEETGCLHFPSVETAKNFFSELAAENVPFFFTQAVNGKLIDSHMFSCGTGALYHGTFEDIYKQLKKDFAAENNPELQAKLSQGIEKISSAMSKENNTVSMKDRLRDLSQEARQEEEEEQEQHQENDTAPNPFRIKLKPKGAV